MSNFHIKFITFTLLIWILQCSNNPKFYKSWNYKNNIENISYFINKRSLTESNIKKQAEEHPKLCTADSIKYNNHEGNMMTEPMHSRNKQSDNMGKKDNNIEKGEDIIECIPEDTLERNDESTMLNLKETIKYLFKNNFKSIFLYTSVLLSFIACLVSMKAINSWNPRESFASILLVIISIILTTVTLIKEELKNKVKDEI